MNKLRLALVILAGMLCEFAFVEARNWLIPPRAPVPAIAVLKFCPRYDNKTTTLIPPDAMRGRP